MILSNEGNVFQIYLRIWNCQKISEAYNWVVSICLKYVSLPWIMVNSLLRGASEPCAWREFYKKQSIKVYHVHLSIVGFLLDAMQVFAFVFHDFLDSKISFLSHNISLKILHVSKCCKTKLLVVCTWLYKPLYWLVHCLVCPLVHWSLLTRSTQLMAICLVFLISQDNSLRLCL